MIITRRSKSLLAACGVRSLSNVASATGKAARLPSAAPVRVGEVDQAALEALREFVHSRGRLCVLTGAGVSTASGIPDYRGPNSRPTSPIQFGEFLRSYATRRRYWARSFLGHIKLNRAEPNDAHYALGELEQRGVVGSVITQNVDGLHFRGGSRSVVELHGSLRDVVCVKCDHRLDRDAFQRTMYDANPKYAAMADHIIAAQEMEQDEAAEYLLAAEMRPDGDVVLDDTSDFVLPHCPQCDGSFLKPDVVFFGDNVPRDRVEHSMQLVAESDGMLVVGSSLHVWSGYRFAKIAHERLNIPIAIVNIGPTRADPLARIRIDGVPADQLLPLLL